MVDVIHTYLRPTSTKSNGYVFVGQTFYFLKENDYLHKIFKTVGNPGKTCSVHVVPNDKNTKESSCSGSQCMMQRP